MSQKLNTVLALVASMPIVIPVTWAAVSLASDLDVDADMVSDMEAPEAPPVELRPVNVPLQDALYRSGLNPEALAASGVTSAQVEAMCNALRTDLVEVQPILATADAGVAQGRSDVGRLKRLIRSGKATEDELAQLAHAKSACEAAMAEQTNCMNHFHAAACAVLTDTQRATLRRIRRNSKWKVPTPYMVLERTPEQWMQLEEYLDVERIETRWGHEVPAEVVAVLSEARADAAFATANAAHETNLSAVETAADSSIRD